MAVVFVSYARPDEPHAKRVADALRAGGYEVWRDDELPAHRAYADVIQERLQSANAVVVLWSVEAAKSQWVRAEADSARNGSTLVQATLDGTIPPLPFNQIQCADLTGWSADIDALRWRKLVASVAELTGSAKESGTQTRRPPREHVSVCVLPFANMSGDIEQEYFSDGISEDITTDLSKISVLEVIARNTAFQFKGQSVDVCEIAEKLNISYDRDLTDIFAIQDEISKAIVDALKVKLLPEEKRAIGDRCTCNVDAYNLYLMARQAWITSDFGDRRREEKVIRICERAVELDPDYPHAWALMGLAQANLHHGFAEHHASEDGSAAAERALALDPNIAEAHLPKAWRLAEEGRHDEANAEIAIAIMLNPDSWEVNKEAARLFYRQRKLDDAARYLEKATQVMEADYHGLGMLFAYYYSKGDLESARRIATKALEQCEKALSRDPDNGAALAFGAMSLAALGNLDRSREWIERSLLVDPDNLQMRYNLAWGVNRIFCDPEAATEMLGPVMAHAGPNIIRLAANDPNLDNLRNDPRFATMMLAAKARVGLSPESPFKPILPA